MENKRLAVASHTDWYLPYVLGATLFVRRVPVNIDRYGKQAYAYYAERSKKCGRALIAVRLGRCDPLGYPLPEQCEQLQMPV